MKFISLFSGVGGFDLGFGRSGMECKLQVEIDKYASAVLKEHWPDILRMKDVKNVNKSNAPAADLICGGFPCQDLSVAGRRAGLAGEKSGLWFQFARIIEELRPRWVAIENVPGLLSSGEGRDMGILTGKLAELGYWWAYRVLDSQYFGVAQRRRRVFIVANLRDAASPTKVLFEPESGERDTPPSREKGKISPPLTATGVGAGRTGNERNELDFAIPIVPPITVKRGGGSNQWPPHNEMDNLIPEVARSYTTREGQRNKVDQDNYLLAQSLTMFNTNRNGPLHAEEIAQTLDSVTQAVAFQQNTRDEVRKMGGDGQIAGALAAEAGMKQQNYLAGIGIRRLTPTECERLQGFPDGWTSEHSDTQRYKMMGNAVTVNVAEWLGKRIIAFN